MRYNKQLCCIKYAALIFKLKLLKLFISYMLSHMFSCIHLALSEIKPLTLCSRSHPQYHGITHSFSSLK